MDGFSSAYNQLHKCLTAIEAQEKTAKSMASALHTVSDIYTRTENDVMNMSPEGFKAYGGAAGAAGTVIISGGAGSYTPDRHGSFGYGGPETAGFDEPEAAEYDRSRRIPDQASDRGAHAYGNPNPGNRSDRDELWYNAVLNGATEPCRPPKVIMIGTVEVRTMPVIEMMAGVLCGLGSCGVRIRLR